MATQAGTIPFILNYRYETTRPLFRMGEEKEPMDKKLKTMKIAEYMALGEEVRRNRGYNARERRRQRRAIETPDFLEDDRGFILTESSGLSAFADEETLQRKLGKPGKDIRPLTWWLKEKTPFPEEFDINLNTETLRASIKPAQDGTVTPQTFLKMLSCLNWVKKWSSEELKSK